VDQFENLTREQLLKLLRQKERQKKLGLVWERDSIERDRAIDERFVSLALVPELGDGAAPWPNLVIEGDNFDALRWLRMTMAGQFRCILIDPPYNTGNKDWVYNDHYIDKEDAWRHSTWLEFLYQRLMIARDLLARDGVLIVTIDDDNRARLDLLLEEVLPGMRVGSLVWRTRDTTAAKGNNLSDVHEHILVYANPGFQFAGSEKDRYKYKNPDNDPRGDWNTDPLTLAFSSTDRANLFYPLHNPETDIWYPCDHDRVWAFASKKRLKPGQKTRSAPMEDQIQERLIVWPRDERVVIWHTIEDVQAAVAAEDVPRTPRDKKPLIRESDNLEEWVGRRVGFGRPGIKKFWTNLRSHVSPLSSWIARINEDADPDLELIRTGAGGEGTNEIQKIFGLKAFPNPKPLQLIRELVRQSVRPNDMVLDFFAGSATTAHAVMELNYEDDGGRRFVMVSSTEATTDDPGRNICRDVTAERIRRLNAFTEGPYAGLKAPFAYLRTHEIAFEDIDYALPVEEAWQALAAFHGLPLTRWADGARWGEHAGDGVVLLLVERVTSEGLAAIQRHADVRANLFVYAFAPGQLRTALEGLDVEVRGVRETLVRRFVP
jgi:adenine-specific DNA-methyltransferase